MVPLVQCRFRGVQLAENRWECNCPSVIGVPREGVMSENCAMCPMPSRPTDSPPRQVQEPPTDEEKAEYPSLIEMAASFIAEWRAWRKAGKPIVSTDVREQRRELCLACDKYDPEQDRCTKCGCYLHKIKIGGVIDADALSWATKQCPLDPPRWLATVAK